MAAFRAAVTTLGLFTQTHDYLRRARRPKANLLNLKEAWARSVLARFGVATDIIGTPISDGPILFVGNHVSYLDIPLIMTAQPKVSFVAKKEISRWPIIGAGAEAMDTIFVDRGTGSDRSAARAQLKFELKNGAQIAVFPSGTTCIHSERPWRFGVFEIARDDGFSIQPFRIRYTPLRSAAYIDRDLFPVHLYNLARTAGVKATLEFHPPVAVEDAQKDGEYWRRWASI